MSPARPRKKGSSGSSLSRFGSWAQNGSGIFSSEIHVRSIALRTRTMSPSMSKDVTCGGHDVVMTRVLAASTSSPTHANSSRDPPGQSPGTLVVGLWESSQAVKNCPGFDGLDLVNWQIFLDCKREIGDSCPT